MLLLVALFAYHLFFMWHGHEWGWDSALYVDQAVSLTHGQVVDDQIRPFGFPILLVIASLFGGPGTYPMQVMVIITLIALLAAFWVLIRTSMDEWNALLLVAVVGLSPQIVFQKGHILSDIPYACFFFIALLLIRYICIEKDSRFVLSASIFLGFIMAFGTSIRTVGIMLIPTLLTIQGIILIREGFRWPDAKTLLRLCLPYLSFVLFYIVYIITFGNWGQYYVSTTPTLISLWSVVANLVTYPTLVLKEYFPGTFEIRLLFYLFLIPFLIIGLRSRYKEDFYITIAALWYFGAVVILSVTDEPRYAIAYYPIFMYFVFQGLIQVSSTINLKGIKLPKSPDIVTLCALILILMSFASTIAQVDKFGLYRTGPFIDGPDTPEAQDMFRYVRDTTTTDAKIGFRYRGYLDMYTGRKNQGGFPFVSPQEFVRTIDEQGIGTVLIEKRETNLTELIEHSGQFSVVKENQKLILYQRIQA
ncbi:MAG TPA: hypothetical protein VN372_00290 [Methanospirillum sp.]|nr:hypothetical protein [Methanospirillum sp.]